MLHKSASSGRFQARAGSANIAEMAGARRGWPASASKPGGACSDSLAARNTSVNSAELSALSIAYPPSLSLADSMRTVTVTMKVEAKEEIKTPAGTFQTIRVEPTADEGVVKNRGNIWVWYTDDARHMPVQIRAHLFWGTITARLQSYE